MKYRLFRRNFIASAAFSMVPSVIAWAQLKSDGLLGLFGDNLRPTKLSTNQIPASGKVGLYPI